MSIALEALFGGMHIEILGPATPVGLVNCPSVPVTDRTVGMHAQR